ncbi:unnamed protein product [Penicillium glandicola]
MEVAGIAFAIPSLFSELVACVKSLHRFSRDIRMAKKEVKLLRLEIENCRLLASIFEEVIRPIENKVMQIARATNLEQQLREQSKLAHDQIRDIAHKLKPLHRGKSSGLEKFRAKIRWHFTKDDFQFPMATLGSVKSSLNLLASFSMLDSAVANFSQIPDADVTIKSQALDRITALEKQTRRIEQQFSESMRVLHEQSRLDGHPDSAGNIQSITVIIKEIRRGTVNDARDLLKRFSNQSQVIPPTNPDVSSQLTSVDDMYSPNLVYVQGSRYPGPEDQIRLEPNDRSPRSRSLARDDIRIPTNEHTPVGSGLELRRDARDESPFSARHRDRDVIVVDSEIDRPVSHASDDIMDNPHSSSASRTIYQPMPPFNGSDLREMNRRNRRRQSRSRSDKGE